MANKNTVIAPPVKKIKTKGKSGAGIMAIDDMPVSKPTLYFSDQQLPAANIKKIGEKITLSGVITGITERQSLKGGKSCNYDVEIKSAIVSKKKGNKNTVKDEVEY